MDQRRFIKACRREPVDRVPVWMMRQAGRYQPEYRALKERVGGFWGLCTSPEAVAEATLFAQRSLDTDAAIIFSDITVPSWAMGLDLEFSPGPRFSNPVRDAAAVDALVPQKKSVEFLEEGIRQTRAGLADDISLIGFVGAPLTLAGYMIEGYPSKTWVELKKMVYGEAKLMERLLSKLADTVIEHARIQVEAGCDAVQIFESSAGLLDAGALHRFAFAYSQKVIEGCKGFGVPVIYFARDVGAHLETAAELGADVLGVDWTVKLNDAHKRVGDGVALQGNMDPGVLFCSGDTVEAKVNEVMEEARDLPGFIFNLGHGILVDTPVDNAKRTVETVHKWSR